MVKRLFVHNYRCLTGFELSLEDHSTFLLIGKNGSGKSTVGRVLAMLQQIARGKNDINTLVSQKDQPAAPMPGETRIEISIELSQKIYTYAIELNLVRGAGEFRFMRESLTVDGKPIFDRVSSEVTVTYGAKGHESTFSINAQFAALPILQASSSDDPIHIFRTSLAHMLILRPVPSHMSGDSRSAMLEPDESMANFAEWWSGLMALSPAAYAVALEFIQPLLPDLQNIINPNVGRDTRSLSVQFKNGGSSLELSFDQLSDGEKCMILAGLVVASNEIYGPLLCFWDEPDNFLAPSEIGQMIIALRSAFIDKGQLIAVSHNPEAIRSFSRDNTAIFTRESHHEPVRVQPLKDLHYGKDLVGALIRGDVP